MMNIINNKNNNIHIKSDTDAYAVQCLDCNKTYVGEKSRLI